MARSGPTYRFDFDAKERHWTKPLPASSFPSSEVKHRFEATWRAILKTTDIEAPVQIVRIDVQFSSDDRVNEDRLIDVLASQLVTVLTQRNRTQSSVEEDFFLSCERILPITETQPFDKIDLTDLFLSGSVFALDREYTPSTGAYLEAARHRETKSRELLFSRYSAVVGTEVRKLANRRFPSDETGYRESADVIGTMHMDVAAAGAVLTYRKAPVFLRRELPPNHCDGSVEISVCDYHSGDCLKTTSHIPSLSLSHAPDFDDQAFGQRETLRQAEIENLRRQLVELIGRRAGSPQATREIRDRINSEKSRLQTALGYIHDDTLTRVMMISGKSSFQLKRTDGPQARLISTVQFPELFLIDLVAEAK